MEKRGMRNFLVLLAAVFVAAILVSGCVRRVSEDASQDNLSELGIIEGPAAAQGGEALAAPEVTGSVVAETTAAASGAKEIVVYEGELVSLKLKGVDADGDPIKYTFSPPLDANGKWQTKKGDKGVYNVQVSATDGKAVTTKDMKIVVKEENKAPVLEAIDDISVKVGDTITISPKATDPNNDQLTFSYSGWMTSATKVAADADVGSHNVLVTVSDGQLEASKNAVVKIDPLNAAPVMEKIPDVTVREGETVSFNPKVIDPDGDKVTIAYDGWMKSNSYTTTSNDAGNYAVKITASDGQLSTTQTVQVTVLDVNRAPEFEIEIG